ncbi:MAG: PAS domain S-box protein [Planctomycetes bacterium]|nr:PAS domain S-box protein [Planctomycetota bacterium]
MAASSRDNEQGAGRQGGTMMDHPSWCCELVDHLPVGFYGADVEGRILEANPALIDMLAFSDFHALDHRPLRELFFTDEDYRRWRGTLEAEGSIQGMEVRLRRRDGRPLWVESHVRILARGGDHRPWQEGAFIDITGRRGAAESLRRSEATLNTILQIAPAGIGQVHNRVLTWCNESLCRMLGYDSAQLVGRSTRMLYEDEDQFDRAGREMAERALREPVASMDARWRRSDGEVIDVLLSAAAVKAGDAAEGFIFTAVDISQTKRTERALAASERRFRELVETMAEGLGIADAEYRFTYVNRRFAEMLGYSPEAMVGRSLLDFVREDHAAAMRQQMRGRRAGQARPYELAWRAADGRTVWTISAPKGMFDEQGRFVGSFGVLTDITDRKRGEDALRDSEARYRTLVENLPQRISLRNTDRVYITCNVKYASDFGLTPDQVRGRHTDDILPPEMARVTAARDARVLQTGQPAEGDEPFDEGGKVWIHWITVPVKNDLGEVTGLLCIYWDVSEQRRAAAEQARLLEQLRRAQKMEALGRLASGMAHDFNNQLTVIGGYCDMLLLGLGQDDPAAPALREILNATERSMELTGSLLALGRKHPVAPQTIDPAAVIGELTDTLARTLGEDIRLSIRTAGTVGFVKADRSQLEQAVINMAINARDAMARGGDLVIGLSGVDLPPGDPALDVDVKPGRFVELLVRDTGVGMDEKTLQQIFEPFFTTKGPGKGTGLGLSMVYGFVKQSGGQITVDSTPGAGTTFRMYLPQRKPSPRPAAAPAAQAGPLTGTETVLVVEDEQPVRQFIVRLLEHLGYTVLESDNPLACLHLASTYPESIDLLISDVVMPDMRGPQVAHEFRGARPKLRVLFISGYSEGVEFGQELRGVDRFLAKPFSSAQLQQAVRDVLDAPETQEDGR